MASTTEMQRVRIADIRPYENNAKIHGAERMHHRVKWVNCVPEILSERWKK